MEELMDKIIECIKTTDEYKEFMIKSELLKERNDLLLEYQAIMQEYDDLKKYSKYMDMSNIKAKVRNIKEKMANDSIISEYYQSYYKLNNLLENVTKLIFKDVIDESLMQNYFE